MTIYIDLNCDLGEYDHLEQGELDAAIMPFISSCNIACGSHAGNTAVIEQTIQCAVQHGVHLGAHPSYPDRTHFGRRVMHLSKAELKSVFTEQVKTLQFAAQDHQAQLSHVKPHGALYNQAAKDPALSWLLLEAVNELDEGLWFYGLAHSATAVAAKQMGVKFVAEGFVDRGYSDDRTLQPRGEAGAMITDPEVMLERVLQLLETKHIESVSGQAMKLEVDTLCLHGDSPGAMQTAQVINQGLQQAGIRIVPPSHRP